MKILVYGAGAIGSIFAGKMAAAGFDVTILARNARYKELKEKGLILKNALSQKTETIQLPVISSLDPDDI